MRRVIITVASLVAAIALPAVAGAGSGATHDFDSWTNEPTEWFQGEPCDGSPIVGRGLESGSARITETANGGAHVTGSATGVVPFYQANGPGPWDPQPGAYARYVDRARVHFDEQVDTRRAGDGRIGLRRAVLVYPDGSSQFRQVLFRLVRSQDGPPRLFLVKFVCGGVH